MRSPPAMSYLEEPDGWRDDETMVRLLEERLASKIRLGLAGLLPPLPAATERLVDRIVERLRLAQP